MVTLKKGFWN